MSRPDEQELFDRIYEAAIIPGEWRQVMDSFSGIIGAVGGTLFSTVQQRTHSINSESLETILRKFAEAGFTENNRRVTRAFERGLLGFMVSDFDLFTQEEMDRDPMYACLRTIGIGWCVGSMIQVPNSDTLVLAFERTHAKGPFSAEQISYVESFRPHLTRAALLSARLGFERAKAASEAMGLVGLATAVIGLNKRLVTANALFQPLIPSFVRDTTARVSLSNPQADAMLAKALDRALAEGKIADVLSLPVPASEERPAFALHVVPVRRAANDIFSAASCLLVATPVARREAPQANLIQGLFDLSGAETRLVQGLVNGESITNVAFRLGVSTDTVRTQLKSVFAKTGVHRQADLIALLGDISLPFSKPL
jgi:DNA-binding NarL/FixJ family response regulator